MEGGPGERFPPSLLLTTGQSPHVRNAVCSVLHPTGCPLKGRTMRSASIPVLLAVVLISATSVAAQTAGPQVEKTYGVGLPRDRDVLLVPDENYPDWPLRADQTAYAGVSGDRMKDWVRQISAISLQSQAAGNLYWGRLPGTPHDVMTMDLMINEFERLGLETERVPHTIPTDWSPTFWEASYSAGGRSVELLTAFPAGQTAAAPSDGLTAEAVWVGVGAEPDFLGRNVEGKAVVIYSTFVPGGRSHSASDRAGIFGANTRASERGAAMIVNVMAVPGNAQFNPLGAPSADYGVPLITVSQDEGFALSTAEREGHRDSLVESGCGGSLPLRRSDRPARCGPGRRVRP